jgi:hypothetical protein
VDHGGNYSPNIEGAEIAENKIEWYFTVITIDYIDQKKNKSAIFKLSGAEYPIAPMVWTEGLLYKLCFLPTTLFCTLKSFLTQRLFPYVVMMKDPIYMQV